MVKQNPFVKALPPRDPEKIIREQSREIGQLRIALQRKDKQVWKLNEKLEDQQIQIKQLKEENRKLIRQVRKK